ncbi:MAG: hypothetical protein L0177_18420 [Chloroflexi bacterium]|nr:hypothetical protein [Chloroflexota bacterium]
MKLSDQDADLFFDLMIPLQFFVNQRLRIAPDADTFEKYVALPMEEKLLVRDALYENIHLIAEYVKENPNGRSADELAIIAAWKNPVVGEFYIERMLKRYAIFVGPGNKVYSVLGLHQALEEMIHPSRLPLYVRAVLLPFKGKIVYDGLFQPYNVYFGRGISSDVKETYLAAKQQGNIIESLEPGAQPARANQKIRVLKDWRPEVDALAAESQKLRSSAGQPPILGPAFSLAKAGLELAQLAVHDPKDLDALWKSLQKVERALYQVENTLNRAERYRDE